MEFHGPRHNDAAETGETSRGAIEPRRLMWAVAEVSWADAAGNPIQSRATIVDISTSGACIRLRDRIGVGSLLTVKWHREQFSATARNCRRDGADYLLGVRRAGAPLPESIPTKIEPAPVVTKTSLSSAGPLTPLAKTVPDPKTDPVSKPGSVRVSPVAAKAIHSPIPEKRPEAFLKRSAPEADSDLRGARARRDAARQERKVMQPKRLFPKFWHHRQEANAPTQPAPKEGPVNKPNPHAVEHVSDPPARLLSYDDIYHAAGIMNPRSGYGIRKVVEMLNSDRIRDLSKEVQRASVLMALDAAGASADELLQDATRRQQALNAYEDGQRKQLEDFEARKAQENAQIDAEMQRITAHYAERIQQNKDEVTQHKEDLHNWQMAKQHESQRISEVIELCGKQTAPIAGTDVMAASAGASGVGNANGTGLQTTGSVGPSKRG
jgi:hypothetical protein